MQIGIIGSGAMGSGIAQLAATASHQTLIFDNSPSALHASAERTSKGLEERIAKGKLDREEGERILNNILYVPNLQALSNCDLIIEAIVEDLDVKKQVFRELEMLVSQQCIIATNTSSLSVTSIAAGCKRAGRVLGIHFFNPAILMPLVEIIPALQTDPEVVGTAEKVIASWGKTIVRAKDTPGFIVNRVARPFYGESFKLYEEGLASMEFIDMALKKYAGFRMGPFELTDFIGHDVNYTVTESVWTAMYFDPRYRPSLSQKRLLEAGRLGRKTGYGFYNYAENAVRTEPEDQPELAGMICDRVLAMLINEAADAVFMGIATPADLETAMTKGVNYPKGLLLWANEIGISKVVGQLDALMARFQDPRYRCSPLLRDMADSGSKFLV